MFNRCALKDGRQRKFFAQAFLDNREQTHCEQRVSPQLEKIVSHPDRPNAQNLLPDVREFEFQVISGRDERFLQLRPGSLRRRQCPSVYLPVGLQRQCIEQHEDGRHHMVRQLVVEKAPQLISGGFRDHIGHEPLLA
jgi:hypothetical protein